MHHVNTTYNFSENSLLEKGNYLVTESYAASFFFLKDKKLKKLAVACKFLYFLTVLSLNFNVFC